MDWITAYEYYKKGIGISKNLNEDMQKLFKTDLTTEQLLLIQNIADINRKNKILLYIAFILLGSYLGFIIGVMIHL